MTPEERAAVRVVLDAMTATIEEQRTADVVDRMLGRHSYGVDPTLNAGYDAALEVAVDANRKARRARKSVTPDVLATIEGMIGCPSPS